MRLSPATLVLVAVASTASAQTPAPAPPEPRFATEVIVTPERGETPRALVPAATVIVDRASIEARPISSPGELTSFLPGFVAVRPEFHAGRPIVSARGFFGGGEADYVLLLVDGVPQADVESGLIDWSVITTSSIQRVEALRGPGASLYGDAAVGGVIQILTNRATRGGQANVSGGSFGTFIGDASHRLRLRNTALTTSGAVRRTAGAFEHSGARQVLAGIALDQQGKKLTWRWNLNADDRWRDDPGAVAQDVFARSPSSSDPLHRFDRMDRIGVTTVLLLRHDSSFRPQGRIRASVREENLTRTILLAPGFGDRRARHLSGSSVGGTLDAEHVLRAGWPVVMRFGVDLAHDHLDTSYRAVDAGGAVGALNGSVTGRRLRTGAFVSSLIDPAPRVRVSAAVRWDGVDDAGFGPGANNSDQRAWSPRVGGVVRLSDSGAVSLFAQVSHAFKVPTLDQRFDPRPYPDFRGGTFSISNQSLVPQRGTNVEAGVSGSGVVSWSVLAYRMAVKDEIDFDVRTFSYGNIGESEHTGVEIEAGRALGRLRPSLWYAFTRVMATGAEHQLKNVPRHLLRVDTTAALPWAVSAYVRYTRSSGVTLDDDGAFPIDGGSTIDLRLRRPFSRFAVFVDALNATGNRHQGYGFTLADFSGRTVPYGYAAAPRAFRAGITVAF